ncbi:casein kinase II beta subunit [Rozella allomycis CSF55]|uniref:Multifunctional fusion protein n=1 Tax=Rozella allomycis (strain CSF55) TaxID=988480 RepID=A0A075B1I7_ROZAC|nr:Phospholipid/glycerol acyltransferase domain-containing protein [Rozella allomycis CSF55]RKP22098.1 casein kinase II beta subunit [Rozella allomycis CSF55]|eukprot:EPZ36451.1 Phospholipid/glycerol acyltransferase domain-containing protein [Rozella allomycis CSF55]
MPGSMSDTYQDASSNSDSYDSSAPWIQWFTSLEGHEYLIPVAEEFIEDDFNLTGLQSSVPFYRQALDMILDVEMDPEIKDDEMEKIEASASSLFLLIHQRFLLSKQGLHLMASRYRQCDFGECPRMLCRDMPLIPIGLSDIPGKFSAKLFCPNCVDIYNAPFGSTIDGMESCRIGLTIFTSVILLSRVGYRPLQFYSKVLIEVSSILVTSVITIFASPFFYVFGSLYDLNYFTGFIYTNAVTKKLLGLNITVENHDVMLQQPCIYMCNHQSSIDTLILGAIVPRRTVVLMKRSILYYPLFGLFAALSRNIFINRKNYQSALDSLAKAAKRLKEDNLGVFVFPEGTRSHSSSLLPFKKGSFHLAIKAGVPIIPVVVSPYNHLYSSKARTFLSGDINVKVNYGKENVDELISRVRDQMNLALAQFGTIN